MKLSSVFYYAVSLGLLDVGSAVSVPTSQGISARQEPDLFPQRCYPNPCKNVPFDPQYKDYVCGDKRLGPLELPKRFPISAELATYSRFGDHCADEYLLKWVGTTDPKAWFKYPTADGFLLDASGKPIQSAVTLRPGQKLDRFGNPTGKFFAPLGAPYLERSLPPANLAPGASGKYPDNYHVYLVQKPLQASLGPIAPWFGQPGLGSQIHTQKSAEDLMKEGYLKELGEEDFSKPRDFAYDPPEGKSK
ncbi:hypothetical protein McanMca71_003089 [Microsporum canis]|uniref:TNT domain-containing protein n=1 Tax=Arthroderma otae (strain ATCC MYA-4605 / CBS 113480) TaxID=554155 RepID=C5G042_ARTOC|nr:conserved hypothetical protein [Microsporum canis CBS 113480]EEQ35495.1 conserved hypothetical protein [Microsporum canis CBS 113480]